MTNLQIMAAGISELKDSPLVLLHPASRTLLEAMKAAHAELTEQAKAIQTLKLAAGL